VYFVIDVVILFDMIRLSRSCIDMSSIFCNMFIIYFWIKLDIIKVLIYPTAAICMAYRACTLRLFIGHGYQC
jgi:hypothetical protein